MSTQLTLPWGADSEKDFAKLNYSKLATPSYVIHLGLLEKNLKILANVKKKAGCKILLALKGYSAWSTFPLVSKYLDGVCASSVNEAKLGREEFCKDNKKNNNLNNSNNKYVEVFAPAYFEEDIKQHIKLVDEIIFNSFSQWKKYKPLITKANKNSKKKISCGIRINPESAGAKVDLYNPCAKFSRMGVTIKNFKPKELEGIEGLHFHALCEQGADDLAKVLIAVEKNFGKYIYQMKWVNFGGGHHITRKDYDLPKLVKLIKNFKKKYNVEVILEPGEAVALNAGALVTSVLDIVENEKNIAILDISAEAHMPDVLAMPYRPEIVGAGKPNQYKHTYRLGGVTCLSGDMIGDYSFKKPLKICDKLIFLDMAVYTMVKNTLFNGIQLPSIAVYNPKTKKIKTIKEFGYKEFKERLS